MNILFVTGDFPIRERNTNIGGMAGAVYKSALGMQNRGHRVRILAVSNFDRRGHYRGLNVIYINATYRLDDDNVLNVLNGTLKREIIIRIFIKKLNKEEHIDIIQYTGWFGVGLFHNTSIPAVMRVSSYTKIQLANNYNKDKKLFLECVEYLAAKRMNFIFAPSRIMADGISKDLKKRVAIIETPFYRENIKLDYSIWNAKLKNKKYILFFGRMTVDKGILVMMDAIYPVLNKHEDLYFVFVGSAGFYQGISIKDELINCAGKFKNRVVVLDSLSQEKLVPIIKGAEIIALPSLADNLPNSCAEAMALGKIVIGTNGSSIEQFISDGINGFLTKIGSSEKLVDCIEYVLNLDEDRKRYISQNAVKRINKLDLKIYSKKMEYIYDKVINCCLNGQKSHKR